MKENLDDWIKRKQKLRESYDPKHLFDGLRNGDRTALSKAITLIESNNDLHRPDANTLLQKCLPYSGNSIRVGITGVPGVGKSTFIESFGQLLIKKGKKIAVLAIDPSSGISGGSILGDKTRMQELSVKDEVFIRPSPAGETLGGVARRTRETILLCEAAGYDYIIIETVGVGQSETVVKWMVDFFLLLMLSGAGDELQGIKKGIMEMADALLITKADGDNVQASKRAAAEYRNALHLFPPNKNGWIPEVYTVSALQQSNLDNVFDTIDKFERHTRANGFFVQNRLEQDRKWLKESLKDLILSEFFHNETMLIKLSQFEDKIKTGEMTSFQAAEELFKEYVTQRKV